MFRVLKEQFPIYDMINMYKSASININPSYQRTSGIWSKKKNQLLIDSILNGVDLPKFYMHLFPEEGEGMYKYAVIDGKQRLLAIIGFYDNQYPLAPDFVLWDDNSNHTLADKFFKDIEAEYPRLAGRFLNFLLDFTIIDSDDMNRVDTMFIRINEGIPVNPAEKRNARGGNLIKYIAKTCKENPFFMNTIPFKDDRKSYQELFLKLFVLEKAKDIVTLSDGYINKVLDEEKNCDYEDEIIVNQVSDNLRKMADAFGTSEKLFKKSNVILYYWFLKDKDINKAVAFIRDFEKRRKSSNDTEIQVFNELTRQGIYKKSNLEERLRILNDKYKL